MFKPSKKVAAALGVVTIAGTAGMVAVAPSANAAETVKINMTCDLPLAFPDVTADFNFSLELPAKVAPGGTAAIKVDMGTTPVPAPVDLPNGIDFTLSMEATASGGATGPAALTGGKGKIASLVLNQGIKLPPFELSYAVPANATGDIDLTLTNMLLTAALKVPCKANGNAAFAKIKVDVPAPSDPTLSTTPGEVKPGGAVTVSGDNWPAGTPAVELCDGAGANCDPSKVTGALTVADGKLSGTATVGTGVADGAYQLKVTVGDKSKTSNVSVKGEVPSTERKIAITPNHGPVGTVVTVTGEKFTPNTQLYVVAANAAKEPDIGSLKTPTTDAEGKFSVDLTVGKADTVTIAASEDTEGKLSGAADFKVDGGGEPPAGTLDQDITGTIAAGGLTISQEAGAIKLSDVTLNGQAQNMTGALNTVTVKDFRAGNTGWTLTGAVTDFTNGAGGTIAAEKFSWTPSVKAADGSPSVPVAGSTGPIGKTGATLASAPNAETTGGTFAADAGLSLAVPAYQASGNYSATLTLSIS